MITNNIIFTKFSAWRFNFGKAKDSYIWDDKGKKYIDFTSGWNVANLGWNRKEVIDAGVKQLKRNSYSPMWALDKAQKDYATKLLSALGGDMKVVARATGGMESIEMAIKTARVFTKRKKIVSFFEQFHGSSINALSFSYRPEWMGALTEPRTDIIHLEYPNTYRTALSDNELLQKLENDLEGVLKNEDVAAVITEAGIITGWGSTYVAPKGFISLIRRLTKKYNTLLILDEVGTGFSRLGSLFGMHHFNVKPDIATFAKGITNGSAAMGAMTTTQKIAEETYLGSNLQSTFGWNPAACAMASQTLDIHMKENTAQQAKEKGEYIKKVLQTELKDNRWIGDIRGTGMEIGIDFVKDKESKLKHTELVTKVSQECFHRGLHTVCDFDSNLQLMPPLTTPQKVLDKGLDILIDTIHKVSK